MATNHGEYDIYGFNERREVARDIAIDLAVEWAIRYVELYFGEQWEAAVCLLSRKDHVIAPARAQGQLGVDTAGSGRLVALPSSRANKRYLGKDFWDDKIDVRRGQGVELWSELIVRVERDSSRDELY